MANKGKRMLFEEDYNYVIDLKENHPDPSASWGGGSGGDYTAGEGIIINNNEISVDTEDVAMVSNLSNVAFSGSYNDLSNTPTIPTATSDLTNDSGFITSSDLPTNYVTTDTAQTITGQKTYTDNYFVTNNKKVTYYDNTVESYNKKMEIRSDAMIYTTTRNDRYRIKVTMPVDGVSVGQNYYFPKPTGTTSREFAMVDQIPDAVSGTNDGTNWTSLTIGNDTYGLASGGSTYTAGNGIDITGNTISIDNTVALKTDIPTVPTDVSAFTNDAGYITGINSSDVITALGYTPGTSNFSGSYNDLTDKPTIPTDYSYGYGLSTNGSTVSIDTSVVPTLSDNNSYTGTNTFKTLQVAAPKANFGLVSTQNSTADDYRRGLITFQDYNVHQAQLKLSTKDTQATQLNSWYAPIELNTGSGMDISFKRTNGDSYKLPSKTAATYTIATTDDIPTNVSELTNDSGFITSSALNNYVTTDTTQTITGGKTFNNGTTFNNTVTVNGNLTVDNGGIISSPWYRTYNNYLAYDSIDINNNWTSYNNHTITQGLAGDNYTILLPNKNGTMALTSDIPTDVSDLNNDAGYITGINSSDVTTALGYTPGTSNFSGSYNDLTNKPTIPTKTSDLTNDSGYITANDIPVIPQPTVLYNVPNGEAGVNPITMSDSFANYQYVDIQYRDFDNAYEVKCVRIYDPDGKHVYLDWDVLVSGAVYAKKSIYILSGNTMTVKDGTDMQAWYNNGSTMQTQVTPTTDYQHQIKITKVVGWKDSRLA